MHSDFRAALTALRAVGAIAESEEQDWHSRMLVALGFEPLPPVAQGVVRLVAVGQGPATDGAVARHPAELARFVRTLPGPDEEFDVGGGGRLRLLSVELYDTQLRVQWRLAPLPNVEELYADDLRVAARDTEGLSDAERFQHRSRLVHHLIGRSVATLRIRDDAGTDYRRRGGGGGGGARERSGDIAFSPAPPANATELVVEVEAGALAVRLT